MTFNAMNLRWPSNGLGLLLGCLGFIAFLRCEAQTNLVPNWSFETPEDSCSWQCCFNVGSRPLHWFSWMNSPDHFSACAGGSGGDDSLMAVPQNGWTYQYPWHGEAYAGFYCYDGVPSDYREYLGAELLEPLVPGCAYHLRFRINPAFGGTYWLYEGGVCNNVGMLLTTTSNAWPGISGPPFGFRNFAHLRTTTPVEDTVAWTLVEGTITADSAYAFLVVGNFFTDALTVAYPNGSSWTDLAYYLVDGVEVVPVDAACHVLGVGELVPFVPTLELLPSGVRVRWHGSMEVSVHDALGRACASVSNGADIVEIPLSVSPGLYVLRVESNGRSFVQKFVLP
ncbi:MAG: T9SS type A sorting domain-containing protein [Flavobacteriales bacterium]